jgi:hypothetical protein
MKWTAIIGVSLLSLTTGMAQADVKKLRQLEQRCEQARMARIAPMREQLARECVSKEGKSPEQCKRFYSTWGDGAPGRPPLYNDLPECREALDYARKNPGR